MSKNPNQLACGECGHVHADACPDHHWTDVCPYIGLACPSKETRDDWLARLERIEHREHPLLGRVRVLYNRATEKVQHVARSIAERFGPPPDPPSGEAA